MTNKRTVVKLVKLLAELSEAYHEWDRGNHSKHVYNRMSRRIEKIREYVGDHLWERHIVNRLPEEARVPRIAWRLLMTPILFVVNDGSDIRDSSEDTMREVSGNSKTSSEAV